MKFIVLVVVFCGLTINLPNCHGFKHYKQHNVHNEFDEMKGLHLEELAENIFKNVKNMNEFRKQHIYNPSKKQAFDEPSVITTIVSTVSSTKAPETTVNSTVSSNAPEMSTSKLITSLAPIQLSTTSLVTTKTPEVTSQLSTNPSVITIPVTTTPVTTTPVTTTPVTTTPVTTTPVTTKAPEVTSQLSTKPPVITIPVTTTPVTTTPVTTTPVTTMAPEVTSQLSTKAPVITTPGTTTTPETTVASTETPKTSEATKILEKITVPVVTPRALESTLDPIVLGIFNAHNVEGTPIPTFIPALESTPYPIVHAIFNNHNVVSTPFPTIDPVLGLSCNGKDFICENKSSYLLCSEDAVGVFRTTDKLFKECPAGFACDNNAAIECAIDLSPITVQQAENTISPSETTKIQDGLVTSTTTAAIKRRRRKKKTTTTTPSIATTTVRTEEMNTTVI